jgi:hypothetical protein
LRHERHGRTAQIAAFAGVVIDNYGIPPNGIGMTAGDTRRKIPRDEAGNVEFEA